MVWYIFIVYNGFSPVNVMASFCHVAESLFPLRSYSSLRLLFSYCLSFYCCSIPVLVIFLYFFFFISLYFYIYPWDLFLSRLWLCGAAWRFFALLLGAHHVLCIPPPLFSTVIFLFSYLLFLFFQVFFLTFSPYYCFSFTLFSFFYTTVYFTG